MVSNSPGCSAFGVWRCPGGFVRLFVKNRRVSSFKGQIPLH